MTRIALLAVLLTGSAALSQPSTQPADPADPMTSQQPGDTMDQPMNDATGQPMDDGMQQPMDDTMSPDSTTMPPAGRSTTTPPAGSPPPARSMPRSNQPSTMPAGSSTSPSSGSAMPAGRMSPSGQTVNDPSQSMGARGVTQQGTTPDNRAPAMAGEYPACSRTVTDACTQTYERGRAPR